MQNSKDSVAVQALKFVALFAILAPAAYILIQAGGIQYSLQKLAASSSAAALSALGKTASVDAADPFAINFSQYSAIIIDYCSGALEVAVLFGIIFASTDRTIMQRARGFAIGALLAILFNIMRITLTLSVFSTSAPTASATFHDILFRASIVVFVATYYAIWYYWDFPGRSAAVRKNA